MLTPTQLLTRNLIKTRRHSLIVRNSIPDDQLSCQSDSQALSLSVSIHHRQEST